MGYCRSFNTCEYYSRGCNLLGNETEKRGKLNEDWVYAGLTRAVVNVVILDSSGVTTNSP